MLNIVPNAKSYRHVVQFVCEQAWAILPSKLSSLLEVIELRASGFQFTPEAIEARIGQPSPRTDVLRVGPIAVLSLSGIISQRMNLMTEMSGGTSTEQFAASFHQALDDDKVTAIVMSIDSPGGGVHGVEELASDIYAARGRKRLLAVANPMAASAAYWIGASVDPGEFSLPPTGEVGSIGIFGVHRDESGAYEKEGVKTSLISAGKYKTEGNPFEPLSDVAKSALQTKVDEYYGMFTRAVARGRGVSQDDVVNGFGEGRCVTASQAVSERMVDRIETLHQTINRVQADARSRVVVPGNYPQAMSAQRLRLAFDQLDYETALL